MGEAEGAGWLVVGAGAVVMVEAQEDLEEGVAAGLDLQMAVDAVGMMVAATAVEMAATVEGEGGVPMVVELEVGVVVVTVDWMAVAKQAVKAGP